MYDLHANIFIPFGMSEFRRMHGIFMIMKPHYFATVNDSGLYGIMPLILILHLFGICPAQTADLHGTVKDTFGNCISGAIVRLENAAITATTDNSGTFSLSANAAVRSGNPTGISLNKKRITFRNGTISLHLKNSAAADIEVFKVNGRRIRSMRRDFDAGNHSVQFSALPSGVYAIMLTINTIQHAYVPVIFGKASRTLFSSGFNRPSSTFSAGRTQLADDILSVRKDGFLLHRITVGNTDTGSMIITMLPSAGDVSDIDGNVYQTVRLGSQIWTVENLKTTTYNDGIAIPFIPDSTSWLNIYLSGSHSAACCIYNSDEPEHAKYGLFYNWYAVSTGKLAPHGWHVPSDEDWDKLQNCLINGGYNFDGTTTGNKIAKSMAAQWDWAPSSLVGAVGNDIRSNNSSGFSALPGGLRHWGGSYYSIFTERKLTYWWSSTEVDSVRAWHRWLDCSHDYLDRILHNKNTGFPVRIMRDIQ